MLSENRKLVYAGNRHNDIYYRSLPEIHFTASGFFLKTFDRLCLFVFVSFCCCCCFCSFVCFFCCFFVFCFFVCFFVVVFFTSLYIMKSRKKKRKKKKKKRKNNNNLHDLQTGRTHYCVEVFQIITWKERTVYMLSMVAYNWHLNIKILSRLLLLCRLTMYGLMLNRLPLIRVIASARRNIALSCLQENKAC